ncbi:carboxymuconolactone decarboxylase family protein [Streptomyces sp. NPDC058257]|uniref:carboxymuconolactone decarboxylase family protein n=1 Tax=Streptomyces sp. NPDC058257 TaxID=3346409 RepID=UPI0036E47151
MPGRPCGRSRSWRRTRSLRARVSSSGTSPRPWPGYSEDVLFGQAWEDPDLSPRDRSLVTVASLITSGSSEQLAFHLGKARENGVSDKELIATITHLAFYAGWSKAISAPTAARSVLTSSRPAGPIAGSEGPKARNQPPASWATPVAESAGRFCLPARSHHPPPRPSVTRLRLYVCKETPMEILKPPATAKLPADMFTGDAWVDVIYRGEDPPAHAPTWSASRPAPAPPGTPTAWARPSTSWRASP